MGRQEKESSSFLKKRTKKLLRLEYTLPERTATPIKSLPLPMISPLHERLPASALRLRDAYADLDAEKRFDVQTVQAGDNPACECGAILRGVKKPAECKLFGTVCSPETPMGSCMVSPEGACAAHWTYGRFRDRARTAASRVAA